MVKKKTKSKNFSKIVKRKRYKKLSMKNRLKKVREKRILSLLPSRIKFFYNSQFMFSSQPQNNDDFFKAFCKRFIFDPQISYRQIPKPYCLHLHIPLSFVNELIDGEDVLLLMHRRYFSSGDCLKGRFKGDSLEYLIYLGESVHYEKILIFPFILFFPDYDKAFAEKKPQTRNYADLFNFIKGNHSDKLKEEEIFTQKENDLRSPSFPSYMGRRAVYFKKHPRSQYKIQAFEEVYIRRNYEYLLKNKEKIIINYLENLLFMYFEKEFRMVFSDNKKIELEMWFREELDKYPFCVENYSSKENKVNSSTFRSHGRCEIMKSFRLKTFKTKY